jgi:16S rRNA (cytidine1402-2'-O)-methyltransferase
MLYLVSTPIGNLEDITLRALNTLFSMDLIYCEDTRKTLNLLKNYQKEGLRIPELLSFYEENELARIPEVISKLKEGKEIALVTNAGTPTISDPGFKLVRECGMQGIKVVPVPGPSSPIVALSSSGLATDKFLFVGFLPSKQSQRLNLLKKVEKSLEVLPSTVIFMESPYRLLKSFEDLLSVFGDIEVVVARELTKIYEEIKKEKISYFSSLYKQKEPKGEFIILFNLKAS